MNKLLLIQRLADITNVSQGVNELFLEVLSETVIEGLVAYEKVSVPGLGKFTHRVREAHMGRNPRTGEAIRTPCKQFIKFKPFIQLESGANEE